MKCGFCNTPIWYAACIRAYHVLVEDDTLLTLPEVAKALGVSHVTAWRIVTQEKLLPAQQVGQTWVVWQSAVDAYNANKPDRRKRGRPRKTDPSLN